MSNSRDIYERIYEAFKDDEHKARVLVRAFQRLEEKIREYEERRRRWQELEREADAVRRRPPDDS